MAGNFSDWAPYNNYVQSGMVDGAYANAGFMMLAAGPPRLANIGSASSVARAFSPQGGTKADQIVHPIGIVQNFNLNHGRTFSRIWEIGSERSYFIAGRTVGQLGLGRIYYHGVSLLRVLYAYYLDEIGQTTVPSLWDNLGAESVSNRHDVIIPPGYENIFLNLFSDLFGQPVGLMMYMRDLNQETLGAVYFEACYVPNHTLATDAQGVLIQEQVSIQFERTVPVGVSALSLIGAAEPNAGGADVDDTFLPTGEVVSGASAFQAG
jgi:hypothetical protein